MKGSCSPPRATCVKLSGENGRFVGTTIKTCWQGRTFFKGVVVRLAKKPYLQVQYDDGDVCVIHPNKIKSFIVYRPPRVGKQYQADVPAWKL